MHQMMGTLKLKLSNYTHIFCHLEGNFDYLDNEIHKNSGKYDHIPGIFPSSSDCQNQQRAAPAVRPHLAKKVAVAFPFYYQPRS